MNTCKTCRYWQDDPEHVYSNVKTCTCPKVIFADGSIYDEDFESRTARAEDPEHVLSGDEAAVVDGSGYYGAFMPGPDFGCIHWAEHFPS